MGIASLLSRLLRCWPGCMRGGAAIGQVEQVFDTGGVTRHPDRRTPAQPPGWSDARPCDEQDTLPDSHEHLWRIGWMRTHAQWQACIITGRRRTVDGGWAVHLAWGMGLAEHGWMRWSERTIRLAEVPKE